MGKTMKVIFADYGIWMGAAMAPGLKVAYEPSLSGVAMAAWAKTGAAGFYGINLQEPMTLWDGYAIFIDASDGDNDGYEPGWAGEVVDTATDTVAMTVAQEGMQWHSGLFS